MPPTFFARPADFRGWLRRHHKAARELLVGFHKTGSGRPSITYPEALDEALCFGWIDGVRRTVDAVSYTIRFTPRKPNSYWSPVNTRHAQRLIKAGSMHASGLAVFKARDRKRTEEYSYERSRSLGPADVKRFKASPAAWQYFSALPPGYRTTSIWYVNSARREETRVRRLEQLIACSAEGRRLPGLPQVKGKR